MLILVRILNLLQIYKDPAIPWNLCFWWMKSYLADMFWFPSMYRLFQEIIIWEMNPQLTLAKRTCLWTHQTLPVFAVTVQSAFCVLWHDTVFSVPIQFILQLTVLCQTWCLFVYRLASSLLFINNIINMQLLVYVKSAH